jgi:hypothetical protein
MLSTKGRDGGGTGSSLHIGNKSSLVSPRGKRRIKRKKTLFEEFKKLDVFAK